MEEGDSKLQREERGNVMEEMEHFVQIFCDHQTWANFLNTPQTSMVFS